MTEHTVAAQLSAFTAPAVLPDLPISDVSYVIEDTAVGRMLLARNESGALIASAFVPDADAENAWLHRLARQVSPRVLRLPRALGANPLCIVLPCHRVVAASGALTGYAGGLAAKEYLLALEVHPRAGVRHPVGL